jgi:hypothetical protein
MVLRMFSDAQRCSGMLRLCSGSAPACSPSAQVCSASAQVKAAVAHVWRLKRIQRKGKQILSLWVFHCGISKDPLIIYFNKSIRNIKQGLLLGYVLALYVDK